MATGSNGVEEIYDRMAVIRRERHTNVSDSIAGAEAVMDWGRFTWTYPWIGLAPRLRPAAWFLPAVARIPQPSPHAFPMGRRPLNRSPEPLPRVENLRGLAAISC